MLSSLSKWIIVLLLGTHAGLLAYGATVHSPTLNEPGHLVAGCSYWRFGEFHVYRVNPPLPRAIAALPVLLAGAKTDWKHYFEWRGSQPEWPLSEDFAAVNGERSLWLFTLARWGCIPFSLIGGYICFRWASELYGPASGLMALGLWCFSPDILAHGQLITCDSAAVAMGFLSCYMFWRWLQKPTWMNTIFGGVALGVAELTKTTLVVLLPVWVLLWGIYRWPRKRELISWQWCHELKMIMVRVLIGIYVLNLGYGFEGTFTQLRAFQFLSDSLRGNGDNDKSLSDTNRFADSWCGYIPMPFPKNYLLGIDQQLRDFEHHRLPSYLGGKFSDKGWWYYYLYALAIKVPLGTWLLLGLAAFARIRDKTNICWRDEFILVAPAIVILTFVSSQTGFSEHMRYVLPIFPFIFVWISRIAVVFNRRRWIFGSVVGGAIAWSIGSSILVYPHSLSYFNELVGGPSGGPSHLIHSNVDWGQDLLFLKKWIEEHPEAKPLNLFYFGHFDPHHAGIDFIVPENLSPNSEVSLKEFSLPPGWYAVSVSLIRGLPHTVYDGNGSKRYLHKDALVAFQQINPVARAGYSIYIYHIPESPTGNDSAAK